MLDQYSIKALTPSFSWIKISKQQLFYQWQLLNYWVGKLWLPITVMEVLWPALRKRCIQLSTLLYHIKKFLAGSKAIHRLSKTVKESRVINHFHSILHTAVLKAFLYCTKKIDFNPARPCSTTQASMSCRALGEHSKNSTGAAVKPELSHALVTP